MTKVCDEGAGLRLLGGTSGGRSGRASPDSTSPLEPTEAATRYYRLSTADRFSSLRSEGQPGRDSAMPYRAAPTHNRPRHERAGRRYWRPAAVSENAAVAGRALLSANLGQSVARSAVLLFAVLLAFVGVAPTAFAGPGCTWPFCSEIRNRSSLGIAVFHDWCGTGEIIVRYEPPCGWANQIRYLEPGEGTPPRQDWDVLRVDAGWRYTVTAPPHYSRMYDNRNSYRPMYVRVHDWQAITVANQSR